MVLVNGSEGIGTGWSTYVPNYNPRDIIANLKRLLNNETIVPMVPWYRGFKVCAMLLLAYFCYIDSLTALMQQMILMQNFVHHLTGLFEGDKFKGNWCDIYHHWCYRGSC